MPILLVVIIFACFIGIVLALITLSLNRISGRVIEQYREKLDDANAIMNQGSPPDSWVEKYRQRIGGEVGESAGSSEGRITSSAIGRDESADKIGEQARRQCRKRLKTLISFMEKGNFYDEDQTREMVVKTLKTEYDRWASCHWADLILSDSAERSE